MSQWQPPQHIRPVAIGIVEADGRLLLMAVRDRTGALKGWRPLGGAIEFGERAEEALVREFREETGEEIAPPELLGVLENQFEHNGVRGHEIVFVYRTAFKNNAANARASFSFLDAGEIDEFIVHVIPTFIGEGIPLIAPKHRLVPLKLLSARDFPDGVVRLHYAVERASTRLKTAKPPKTKSR